MKIKFLLAALCFSALLTSCDKEEKGATFTTEETIANTKIDMMNNDVSQIVENQLTEDDGIDGRNAQGIQDYLPNCATVTRVPAYGTTPTVGQLITKTIDFGTTGCSLSNGNVLKGVIVITFTYQPDATSHTINYSFENFYYNAIKFEGNKSFTRVMGTSAANPNSHPIVTMNMDMTATFPSGDVYEREGTRVREIISGYTTVILADNVYQITGSWNTTKIGSSTQISTITEPLIVKLNCSNIVEGIIAFEKNGNNATLDYGAGECDNQAVFTYNGTPFNITLGN